MRHSREETEKAKVETYVCHLCVREYNSQKTYSCHMKTHEDEDKVTSRDDENQPGTSRSQIEIYVC